MKTWFESDSTWHENTWLGKEKQTRLVVNRLQLQYMTRNKGNDIATYDKQWEWHDMNKPMMKQDTWLGQPIKTWHIDQGNQ